MDGPNGKWDAGMNTIAKIKSIRTLVIQHNETGKEARFQREKQGVSLRSLAREMGITPSYLSDLELGRRHWNMDRIRLFESSLERIVG